MEVIVPIAVVLLAFGLVLRLRAVCTLPRRFRARGPACGKCGYAYAGQARCPECGGLIAHVGVITPRLALERGPGPISAIACTALLALLAAGGGYLIGASLEAALLPNGGRTLFGHRFNLASEKKHFTFADSRPVPPAPPAGATPARPPTSPSQGPPEITILQQFVRNQAVPPPFPTIRGLIVLVLHPAGADPGLLFLGSSTSDLRPNTTFPSIHIDPLTGHTRVLDAQGRQTAEYPTIDPRAFSDLVALNQLATDSEFDALALQAAASVYSALAAQPDNGGWGPDWEFNMQRFYNNSVHIMTMGGMTSTQRAPAALLPPIPLIAFIWPPALLLTVLLAALIVLRVVFRRRRALMAEPSP